MRKMPQLLHDTKILVLTEGNSPTINNSAENYPTSATTFPDVEDINKDQTMSAIESYYQYKVLAEQN